MIKLYFYLIIILVFVLSSLLLAKFDGFMIITWHNYEIESSLSFAVLIIILSFIALLLLFYLIINFFNIPTIIKEKIMLKASENNTALLIEKLIKIIIGDKSYEKIKLKEGKYSDVANFINIYEATESNIEKIKELATDKKYKFFALRQEINEYLRTERMDLLLTKTDKLLSEYLDSLSIEFFSILMKAIDYLYHQKEYHKAIQYLQILLEKFPDNIKEIIIYKAKIYYILDKKSQADELLEKLFISHPSLKMLKLYYDHNPDLTFIFEKFGQIKSEKPCEAKLALAALAYLRRDLTTMSSLIKDIKSKNNIYFLLKTVHEIKIENPEEAAIYIDHIIKQENEIN